MPSRKAPQPEEARKLFIKYPKKTLNDWANEWGVSAERVRQIRHEAGVGAVFQVNYKVVEEVAKRIESGKYTLANREMYDDLPIGFEAFRTWTKDFEDVGKRIEEAQIVAHSKKLNPTVKSCLVCKDSKSVDLFKKSQKFIDGYTKVCLDCISNATKTTKVVRKVCMLCKKDKSHKSFTRNQKYKDGYVPFCKDCKSRSRRAKRTLNSKLADTI